MSMAFNAFTNQDVSHSLVEEHNENFTQAQKSFYNGIGNWDTVASIRFNHCVALQIKLHL